MEDHRFDELARNLVRPVSRRQVLKALVATTVGGFFVRSGGGTAWAAGCVPNKTCAKFCASVFGDNTPAAEQCASDAAKCKGLCPSCGAANASSVCCTRNSSGFCTSYSGAACCASGQICCGGKCIPKCTASDQCHVAGTCDPSTGQCSNPAKADGTACDDGNACTQTDTCQAGVCTGSNPVGCTASDQCHVAGTCKPTTGACSNPAAANGTSCTGSNPCQTYTCQSGSCTGVNVADGTSCGTNSVCCSGTCCSSAQVCSSGSCCTPATCSSLGATCGSPSDTCGGTLSCGTCPSGTTCVAGGTCPCAGTICNSPAGCNGNINCSCDQKVEGGSSCDQSNVTCEACSTDADCGPGRVCAKFVPGPGCGGFACATGTVCATPCATTASALSTASAPLHASQRMVIS